jgi:prefoldin subunit 5
MNSGTPSRWQDVNATAEVIAQAGQQLESSARSLDRTPAEITTARDALLAVTAAGARLARQLDVLASAYKTSNIAEPSAVHVALDQAAAAAEDLGNCTKVAAQAIDDNE